MLDRVQLKLEAKAITKNARVSAYLFTLLYLVIILVLEGLDWLASGGIMAEYAYLYGDLEIMEALQYVPRLSLPPLAVTFRPSIFASSRYSARLVPCSAPSRLMSV